MRASKAALAAATALALAGCSLAPDYHRPDVTVAPAYKEGGPWQTAGADVPPAGKWWEIFADPTLSALEERIEAGSPNLAAASARYDQAAAAVSRARAELFPEIDVGGDTGRQRVSAGRPLSSGAAATYTNSQIGASLAYELDLFGRVRNSVRASQAGAEASASDLDAVRLGLQAQLATAYFDMRGLDARIVLLRQTVAAYQRAFDLTDTRHSGGIASGIDVSRAQSQLSSARAELDAIAADRARDEHAIAVLIGESPSTFTIPVADTQLAPPAIPAALPSALLERRPDISAAERRVAAANAQIGVAKAALFPSITLGASAGFEATSGTCWRQRTASGRWVRCRPRWRSSTPARAAPMSASRVRNMTKRPHIIARPCSSPFEKWRTISPHRAHLIDQEPQPARCRHGCRSHARSGADPLSRRRRRLSRSDDRPDRRARRRTRIARHPLAPSS